MNYQETVKKFVIEGYRNRQTQLITDGKHDFVLKSEKDNFISPPEGFRCHRWAGSLKSSQAFAYNVFSGIKDPSLQFEFPMEVFDRPAQVDVKIENKETKTIELFEVKMFEFIQKGTIKFKDRYYIETEYKKRSNIANPFKEFISTVVKTFDGKRIYGEGIKQLCSHLLGILNTLEKTDYEDKKFKLYSFCFDNPFTPKFEKDLQNYKETLDKFKLLMDKFLKEIEVDSRIEYYGFLSSYEYIKKNKILLGEDNYNYVMKRYFFNLD